MSEPRAASGRLCRRHGLAAMACRAPGCPDSSARPGARLLIMDRSRDHDSVRRSYDAVAEHYVASSGGELAGKPLDRALLACLLARRQP